jgi:hypothetical protein
MPDLFFTWALRQDKRVHYEFLDNSVPFGERPRTVAFGWNGEMTILDIPCLLDVDRYRRIDIEATAPNAVYPSKEAMQPERNTGFLRQCMKLIHAINMVAPGTRKVMARIEKGQLVWIDDHAVEQAAASDPEIAAGLAVLAPMDARQQADRSKEIEPVDLANAHTLGCYGDKSDARTA